MKEHTKAIKDIENDEYQYCSTILMFYLLVEKLFAIFKSLEEIGIKETGYKSSFKTMRLIWAWANFFKHPKAFMYVHNPYLVLLLVIILTKILQVIILTKIILRLILSY
ncbi:MAG: hypothetical protein LKG19_03200 [Saprospiraceae bacterium]|nr:hypothetical protein [Saprospiraceae bacterium]